MTRKLCAFARPLAVTLVLLHLPAATHSALAGPPGGRQRRTVPVTRTRVQPCPAPRATSTLGTFYPTPYFTVRGNNPVGGGYSPLDIYGDQTMALYGPLSPLRTMTAPVLTYVRGYDGQTRMIETVSFSNPNLPILSQVRYPTEANYYYGPRVVRITPWGSNAINWIDQN
jgi:hypothetical protein